MEGRRPQFTTLLATSAVGVYLLVVAGATASIADAVHSCSTWPTCQGAVFGDVGLLVAWTHRLLAAAVGVLITATAAVGVRSGANRRVLAALLGGLALYPVQIALGAFVATSGATAFPGAHLGAGMAIFATLIAALAWQLEVETGSDDETPVSETVEVPDVDDEEPNGPAIADLSTRKRLTATVYAYFRLMKPRLMWLLCLVAAAGMALASGTFNHVLERDIDKRMDRTSDRPIATHQLPVRNALAFGIALAAASLALFWQVNALAAALGLAAILFYSVVYTLVLKPNTVQNTVIGGLAGSLPALIGWVAVTGRFDLPGLALAGVIFLWTPAHFYNLALAYKEDYAKGGFPMMPVVRGETETRKHIVYYLGATLIAAGAMVAITPLGPLYTVTTAILGAVFLWAVVRLHREQSEQAAFRAFHASNAYLGTLLLAIVVDALAL